MAVPATTNRTGWFNASDADHLWKTAGNPGTGTPANGDAVQQWDDEDALDMKGLYVSAGPTWSSTGINGLGALNFASQGDMSTWNDAGSAAVTIDTYIANNAFTVFAAIRATADFSNDANAYNNSAVLMEVTSGRWGLMGKTSVGVHTVYAYNFDGNQDIVGIAISQNTDYVVMMRHQTGNLYISINNGSESSVASGNTSGLTGRMQIGAAYDALPRWPGLIGEIILYDAALTGTDFTDTYTYMTDKWVSAAGIKIPVLTKQYRERRVS